MSCVVLRQLQSFPCCTLPPPFMGLKIFSHSGSDIGVHRASFFMVKLLLQESSSALWTAAGDSRLLWPNRIPVLSSRVLFPLSVLSNMRVFWIKVLCESTQEPTLSPCSHWGKGDSKLRWSLFSTPCSQMSLFLNGLVLFASQNTSLPGSSELDATSCFSSSVSTAKTFTTFWRWFKHAEVVSSTSDAFSTGLLSTSHISEVVFTLLFGTGAVPHSSHIPWVPSVLTGSVSLLRSGAENVTATLQWHDKENSQKYCI